MKNRISVIVLDKDYLLHNYAELSSKDNNILSHSECFFDIKIIDNGDNILDAINDFKNVDCIVSIGDAEWGKMAYLPYYYRKVWVHFDDFNAISITNAILRNFIAKDRRSAYKKFSFFTCTYNTSEEKLLRLYHSITSQTYPEWDWFILDDSLDDKTVNLINSIGDPRITVLRNGSLHGNIGFNKHTIAMACDGDYLVEVDHDDELLPDCLEQLLSAFITYEDTDFVFSRCLEYIDGEPCVYSEGWGWGEGDTTTEVIKGELITYSETPSINPYSVRTIYAQPNHVRCWEKNFYHKIGGHNTNLSVLDDMDIIIRTFLYGKMTKVEKCLYIQHEEGPRGNGGSNTQSVRFNEIQRTCGLLYSKYDKQIHDRIIELGFEDIAWDEERGCSDLWKKHIPKQQIMNYIYTPSH